MITENKWNSLKLLMIKLDIDEKDIKENFIRGSGSGGQKINKTSSCVQLVYKNFEIRCQKTRSQADNRFWARRELCNRIISINKDNECLQKKEQEKIRRQKKRRSRRSKQKILDIKSKHSEKKKLRKKIDIRD